MTTILNKPISVLTIGIAMFSLNSRAAFDQDLTSNIIFGDGTVADGGFTVTQAGGVELGLRGKLRFPPSNVFNSEGNGTYTFQAGNVGGRALWNFEWSVNSDFASQARKLDSLTYVLRLDTDPTAGESFTVFDPINPIAQPFWDHGIGNNTTANGAGDNDLGTRDATSYADLIADNNVAQNSWYIGWFAPAFNPNINGEYTFQLEALSAGETLALTEITVNVVPEPTTYAAGALLLLPFALSVVRRKLRA